MPTNKKIAMIKTKLTSVVAIMTMVLMVVSCKSRTKPSDTQQTDTIAYKVLTPISSNDYREGNISGEYYLDDVDDVTPYSYDIVATPQMAVNYTKMIIDSRYGKIDYSRFSFDVFLCDNEKWVVNCTMNLEKDIAGVASYYVEINKHDGRVLKVIGFK